jgi:hypothetical protein
MAELFLIVGDFCPEEVTGEIYLFLALMLDLIIEMVKDTDPMLNSLSNDLFGRLKVMNGSFTKLKIKYWIDLI